VKYLTLGVAALVAASLLAAPARAATQPLDPPASAQAAYLEAHEIDSLAGLPAPIRDGTFLLPDGKPLAGGGWVLAAPGGAWNPTDVVTDPSLPGRRLHFAVCDANACVLHYERGGIAHIHVVMSLTLKSGRWKATWIAIGQPAMKDPVALRALLQSRSAASYFDGPQAAVNY
jgi:hypothetical protein